MQNWLVISKLFFIPRGTHHIQTIFEYDKTSLHELCDDDVTESRNTGEDYKPPEWKHYVRLALDELKKKKVIKKGKRNYWTIK